MIQVPVRERLPRLPAAAPGGSTAGVSIMQATLTIAKTCIGGGVLALPYAHLQGGVLAVPAMCLLGLWNWITSKQLLEAYEALPDSERRGPRTGYSAIAHAALGHGGLLLFDISICMLLTGVCSSNQVQATHLVQALVELPFGGGYRSMVLLSGLCLVPLALLRDLSGLAVVSGVGLVVIAVGLLVVAMSGVERFGVPPPPRRLLALPDLSGVASFFSIAAFSFGLQTNLLPVRDGMREPHRALEVAIFALVGVVCANAAIGVAFAWLYAGGEHPVEQIILLNLPPDSLSAYFVEISTAAVALLGYPLLMLPVMQLLPARLPPAMRAAGASPGLRLGFLACTTALALILREFALAASLCGCLTIFVCLVLPPLCHLRLCSWPPADTSLADSGGGGRGTKCQPAAAALDVATLFVGTCAFAYFTVSALRSVVH
jgi:amino acid permease